MKDDRDRLLAELQQRGLMMMSREQRHQQALIRLTRHGRAAVGWMCFSGMLFCAVVLVVLAFVVAP